LNVEQGAQQQADPRLVWMDVAAARLALFESGEIDMEEACEGLFDDGWTFRLACNRADEEAKKRPIDRKAERLRRLLASDWSLDAVWQAVNEAKAAR
jgi:hypothetical protein